MRNFVPRAAPLNEYGRTAPPNEYSGLPSFSFAFRTRSPEQIENRMPPRPDDRRPWTRTHPASRVLGLHRWANFLADDPQGGWSWGFGASAAGARST